MRLAIAAILGGCAWAPVTHSYPSGLTIVRLDPGQIKTVCRGKTWDNGLPRNGKAPAACYDRWTDTIYLQNNCAGAQSVLHELAHRERIADPGSEGFNW